MDFYLFHIVYCCLIAIDALDPICVVWTGFAVFELIDSFYLASHRTTFPFPLRKRSTERKKITI